MPVLLLLFSFLQTIEQALEQHWSPCASKTFDSRPTFVYLTISFYYFRIALPRVRPHMSLLYSLERGWLQVLSKSQPILAELLSHGPEEQQQLGYVHTLREICQQ